MEHFDLAGTSRTSEHDDAVARWYRRSLWALMFVILSVIGVHVYLTQVKNKAKNYKIQVDRATGVYQALGKEIARLMQERTSLKNTIPASGRCAVPANKSAPMCRGSENAAHYLQCISRATPDTVRIEQVVYDVHKKITVEGRAHDVKSVTMFTKNMARICFGDKTTRGTTKRIGKADEKTGEAASGRTKQKKDDHFNFVFEMPFDQKA